MGGWRGYCLCFFVALQQVHDPALLSYVLLTRSPSSSFFSSFFKSGIYINGTDAHGDRGECTVFIHRKKATDWQEVRLERERKEREMRRMEEEIAAEQKRLEQAEIDGDNEV